MTLSPRDIGEYWPVKLCLNLLGYASLILPIWLFYKFLKIKGILDKAGKALFIFFLLFTYPYLQRFTVVFRAER